MTTVAPEYLTVRELAELLRVKERKVYDLAATGRVPCARATGKLLFPRDEIDTWLSASRGDAGQSRPPVFLGSHDPLLDWAIRQSRCGLATRFESSREGLAAFGRAEGIATGLHLRDAGGDWNTEAVETAARGADVVLVAWARRTRGLVIRPADRQAIATPADLSGRRIAWRQDGAGGQELWQRMFETGPGEGEIRFRSEQDAAAAVADGEADAAFGLASVALSAGLAFVPLIEEHFDILVSRRDWFEPPFQTLAAFVHSDEFRRKAARMGGYDTEGVLGVIRNL